jgi:hypothetical protein
VWNNETIKYKDYIHRLLGIPEFFIPLTGHFHIFQKKAEDNYVVFLYPYESTENVKIGESLIEFNLNFIKDIEGITYDLWDRKKKINYTFMIPSRPTANRIHIMVKAEKRGLFTQPPVDPQHILDHIVKNIRLLDE